MPVTSTAHQQMSLSSRGVVKWCASILNRIVAPLQKGNGPNKFQLSSIETATTTYHGDVGWANRPTAVIECPQCEADITQPVSSDRIDCDRCRARLPHYDFPEATLLYFQCPSCGSQMKHGKRHPDEFEIPEWATCSQCRYHWEFEHSYS